MITSAEGTVSKSNAQRDEKERNKYVEVRLGVISMSFIEEEANGTQSNRLQMQVEKWGIYIINPANNQTFPISKQTTNPIRIV